MKKILITIDDETLQKIQDIIDMEYETMGLHYNKSSVIRSCIHKYWKTQTIQGIESNQTKEQ